MNLLSLLGAMEGAVAQGSIWGIMAIGVFLTFKILDFADLTVDGSLCTGGAVAVMMILAGVNPYIALLCAFIAGMLAGLITGLLHTALGIPPILSGILTQLALYSINMRIMAGKNNQAISVDKYHLVVSLRYLSDHPARLFVTLGLFVVILIAALYWFFGTELGNGIRATGNNLDMARAQGINTNFNKVFGLVLSNGMVALAGGLLAQYQGFSDINMGRGAIVIGLAAVIIGEVLFGWFAKNFALRLLGVAFGGIIYFFVITIVLQLGLQATDMKLLTALVVALFLAVPHLKGKIKKPALKGGN
jgi:putative ABC transport system permease protein